MSFRGAGGRMIELGERQRRLQTEAAGALLFSDCYGRAVSVLGGGGIFRSGLQEDVAAYAVQEGVGPVLFGLFRQRQRFVNPRQGSVHGRRLSFEFGEQTLTELH